MRARLAHLWLWLRTWPAWLLNVQRRARLREMRLFCRQLPERLAGPLPAALTALTPEQMPARVSAESETSLREMADLAGLLERRSPLGLCLRRPLTRYYYLRRAGVPVQIVFGARFVPGQSRQDITGHAWLTLDGEVYHESAENYRAFTANYTFPPEMSKECHTA